jgi:membrane-associated phospholipid phosphatase
MKRLLSLSLSLSLAAAAAAAPFLTPDALDLPALLPAPPAPGSPAALAEINTVLQAQAARTPDEAARCVQIENETIWLFGAEVVGPWFTAANLPKTATFFAAVREDFIAVNRAAKAVHPRQRPPFADPRVKPCVEFADTGAYPSGHGIQSSLWAALLTEISPAHAARFAERAADTRYHKLSSGLHFPSDLAAGQRVGEALARELLKNPAVQRALAGLRTEVAPHLKGGGLPLFR